LLQFITIFETWSIPHFNYVNWFEHSANCGKLANLNLYLFCQPCKFWYSNSVIYVITFLWKGWFRLMTNSSTRCFLNIKIYKVDRTNTDSNLLLRKIPEVKIINDSNINLYKIFSKDIILKRYYSEDRCPICSIYNRDRGVKQIKEQKIY
jgi:hypothetical protein